MSHFFSNLPYEKGNFLLPEMNGWHITEVSSALLVLSQLLERDSAGDTATLRLACTLNMLHRQLEQALNIKQSH